MELYLHVPFCASKCRYCDFASWAGAEALMPAWADAVAREAEARGAELGHPAAETVFVGGGTPSVVPPGILTRALSAALACFPPAGDAEFTSEANPGTLTDEWLDAMTGLGLNRLSMGMQAAQERLLRLLGRIHTMSDVRASVRMARAHGVENLNLDLMFGLPGQTREDWLATLEEALSLRPTHLSCYGLIPEEGTPLKRALDRGELSLPDEDEERRMYDDAIRLLASAGFHQYEISNFALPGRACRHNLGYWRQVPYVGLGPSAASMLPVSGRPDVRYVRETDPRAIRDYVRMVSGDRSVRREREEVSPREAMFETMMLGLRTAAGVSEEDFRTMHGARLDSVFGERLRSLEGRGLLAHGDGSWRLTRRGMDIQNAILVELMDG